MNRPDTKTRILEYINNARGLADVDEIAFCCRVSKATARRHAIALLDAKEISGGQDAGFHNAYYFFGNEGSHEDRRFDCDQHTDCIRGRHDGECEIG